MISSKVQMSINYSFLGGRVMVHIETLQKVSVSISSKEEDWKGIEIEYVFHTTNNIFIYLFKYILVLINFLDFQWL